MESLSLRHTGHQYTGLDRFRRIVDQRWIKSTNVNNGSTTLVSYGVDALGRRISETVEGRDFYYSAQWQVLEERVSGTTKVQYVWSPVYVDAMILRDRDADGSAGNGLEERLYAIQDANWNVTSVMNPAGNVQERYAYDPFGAVTYLTSGWSIQSSSSVAWLHLHQGGRYEEATKLVGFRDRDLSPALGRWLQIDPLRFRAADVNFYASVGNNPANGVDPTGRACCGPEIKPLLERGLAALEEKFKALPTKEKLSACGAVGWDVLGWDIPELIGPNERRVQGSCGQGDCAGTIQVGGKCYEGPHVNYILYGKMNRLCDDLWKTAKKFGGHYQFPDGTTIGGDNGNDFPFQHTEHNMLARLKMYRTVRTFFGIFGSIGNPASWAVVGWTGDWSKADGEVKQCGTCNEKYKGNLTIRVGVSPNLGNLADSPAQIEVSAGHTAEELKPMK